MWWNANSKDAGIAPMKLDHVGYARALAFLRRTGDGRLADELWAACPLYLHGEPISQDLLDDIAEGRLVPLAPEEIENPEDGATYFVRA